MDEEFFEIEFQVPNAEERYITFVLWVKGMWTMGEIGGGEMRECLVIEDMYFEDNIHSTDDWILIKNWIAENEKAIREMFTARLKKKYDL
jgi:hypothetical protein